MPGSDQTYLLEHQYNDASKLKARAELHERFSTNPQHLNRWMFEQLDLPPVARLLELGCGSGDLRSRNIERIPEGWDLTLTDFSPGMLEEAQRNLRDSGRSFHYEQVDAQELPCEDGCFDAMIANFMLYHVPDRGRACSEIARVLKPGACLYAMTNGRTHMRRMRDLVEILAPSAGELCLRQGGDASSRRQTGAGCACSRHTLSSWHTSQSSLSCNSVVPWRSGRDSAAGRRSRWDGGAE